MVDTVFTIGYSGFTISDFISALKLNGVSLVVDVRSNPYSRYFPDYSKEKLVEELMRSEIYYRNYSKEFGASKRTISTTRITGI